jgi:hypothetical protein
MNPFERKFKEFAQNLSVKNAAGNAEHIASKSGEVYKDKPFTDEYHAVYQVAQWGQTFAQIITFCTTAALGVFALAHIIPLWWGIWVAVPLGLLFAFGVEKVKRSTLAIASKHLLKYKTFGFVGFVAMLTLCVSIAAALYGAKELPGVVYQKPARSIDQTAANALTADIERVQSDIDRIQSNLKSEKNWVAENKTLPKLQKERANLIEKRDASNHSAQGRGDTEHAEALTERAAKVDKMQTYSVGAAIVAELVFLVCTGFIFYYLFRHFAETNHDGGNEPPNQDGAEPDTTKRNNATTQGIQTDPPANATTRNGAPVLHARADVLRTTQRSDDLTTLLPSQRLCEHCKTVYTYGHRRQKFCTEKCRVENWQDRNGKQIRHRINAQS